jgi:hypothetical protein
LYARLVHGAIRVLVVAVVIFLATVYLKLGYFIIFLLPIGALIILFVTRRQRAGYPPIRSSLVTIAAYCGVTAVVWSTGIQHREEVRELGWRSSSSLAGLSPRFACSSVVATTCSRTRGVRRLPRIAALKPSRSPPSDANLGCFQRGPKPDRRLGYRAAGGYERCWGRALGRALVVPLKPAAQQGAAADRQQRVPIEVW